MFLSKRITLILGLIIFIISFFVVTNIFENNLVERSIYKNIGNKYIPFIKTTNFKIENKDRYLSYYNNNRNLDFEEIVTHVNIGLDKGFYNSVKNANLSKANLVLINKFNKLNFNFKPNNLKTINSNNFINGKRYNNMLAEEAKNAFEKMSNDAIKNNAPVYGQSAYRSYETQKNIYNNEVKKNGIEIADSQSARPGFSEHQTGYAIDVSSTKKGNMLSFEKTKSFIWLKNNAHKYGFILRYPKNKENITGYIYEPWHYRFVGKEVANDMYNNYKDLTYDEYYYKFIEKKKG